MHFVLPVYQYFLDDIDNNPTEYSDIDAKFIKNFYKYMIEGFTDDNFIINLILTHTLKKVCFKLESTENETLFYQFKHLKMATNIRRRNNIEK